MKYYVVSEDELKEFKYAVADCAFADLGGYTAACDTLSRCYGTCRARPVQAIPGRSTKGEGMCWIEEEV